MSCYMPIIPVLWRQKQEDQEFRSSCNKFKMLFKVKTISTLLSSKTHAHVGLGCVAGLPGECELK